ncbi:hypothetical protein [Photobacterium phosphoreum]|uniref:hypothetical protein n=1 Tax=Photobacterium phosphoreum TaxID=659 RepID=UPI0009EEAFBE|nr:hypothetical protein [Photobacterium phosphoreum]
MKCILFGGTSMNYYVSIVSHNHEKFIMGNEKLKKISKLNNVHVYIKDNVGNKELEKFTILNGYHYVSSPSSIGFGENNNVLFKECIKDGMSLNDYFCVINPDVIIDKDNFELMMLKIKHTGNELFTVDLYKDNEFIINEPSLRYFSTWPGFFRMFVNKPANIEYDKKQLKEFDTIDWAAGSFFSV